LVHHEAPGGGLREMPELPEVETIRRTLAPHLEGRTISEVEVMTPASLMGLTPEEFRNKVVGRAIEEVRRRGKYLLFNLGERLFMIVHLRMTGRLVLDGPADRHTRVSFRLNSGTSLQYVDVRRLGGIYLLEMVVRGEEVSLPPGPPRPGRVVPEGLLRLGPEPLSPSFSLRYLREGCSDRRARIKAVLLDQSFVAGIGNIYADEALFRAGIRPDRRACDLKVDEVEALFVAVRDVLREAIEKRGTTFSDYVDGTGRAGEFREELAAYGRYGEACRRCGGLLARTKVGGRTSTYCPRCQV